MSVQECIGVIVGWILDQAAGAILGAIGGASIPAMWKYVQRRRIAPKVAEAYDFLQVVCEPKTLDPENPGNPDYMKARARNHVNFLIRNLERAGFFPPPRCTTEDDSLQEWYRFLENVRMRIG